LPNADVAKRSITSGRIAEPISVRVTLSANRALVVVDSPVRKTSAARTGSATSPSTSQRRRLPAS
jgi:hypothetical protein